ncbi:hypothetical protein FRC00_005029, partial [Tulasnella sp. 408]
MTPADTLAYVLGADPHPPNLGSGPDSPSFTRQPRLFEQKRVPVNFFPMQYQPLLSKTPPSFVSLESNPEIPANQVRPSAQTN